MAQQQQGSGPDGGEPEGLRVERSGIVTHGVDDRVGPGLDGDGGRHRAAGPGPGGGVTRWRETRQSEAASGPPTTRNSGSEFATGVPLRMRAGGAGVVE